MYPNMRPLIRKNSSFTQSEFSRRNLAKHKLLLYGFLGAKVRFSIISSFHSFSGVLGEHEAVISMYFTALFWFPTEIPGSIYLSGPWNAPGPQMVKPPPDEHNIFKTFLRASFHLLSPDWQVQTYVQTFRHDDSNIWNSFEWSTPMWVVAMGVVAMWVGRVGEGGKAINQVSSIKFDTCWRLFTTDV